MRDAVSLPILMRWSLAGVIMAVALLRCRPECSVDIIQQSSSPDGRYVATVFGEDCHATSPYVTLVNLRDARKSFDSNDDHIFAAHGNVPVKLRWTGADSLFVEYDNAKVYKQQQRWSDVTIEYRSRPAQ